MEGMNEFLAIFGTVTINDVFNMGLSLTFVVAAMDRLKKHLLEKQKIETEKAQKMDSLIKAVEEIPKIKESLQKVEERQLESMKRLDKIEQDACNRERASFKDRLLQSFRYFTSSERNPMMAWTSMESDSFNELYDEYMKTGEDRQLQMEVKPILDKLTVIEMYDQTAIAKLMQSRK